MEHYRKTPRAQWIDYDNGIYFITVCTKNKVHYFGEIYNSQMYLSEIGLFLEEQLKNISKFTKNIELATYTIMPNHFHAIFLCNDRENDSSDFPNFQRDPNPNYRSDCSQKRYVPTLTRYIASLKSVISKYAKAKNLEFAWHPRYHDHLIRNEIDAKKIVEYIENNVFKWKHDCFYD